MRQWRSRVLKDAHATLLNYSTNAATASTLLIENLRNVQNFAISCSNSNFATQQQQQQQQQQKRCYCKGRSYINKAAFSSSVSTPTIDEFRAREELREEEFERQHAAEEEARKKSESAEEQEARNQANLDTIRVQILNAALAYVNELGFTRNAIIKGAEDAGFPSVVHGLFPEGGFALVSYFYGKCNDELVAHLQAETENGNKEINDPLEFLVRAVRMRLEMLVPYKSQWPQALALIAMPQNASTALAQVLTLVDDICYYSGDRSVDFNWYTRRIGLATIMKMTELYLLQDKSTNHENTWEFLKNRMDEAVQLQMMLSQTEDMTNNFQRSFNSAFITARNILGLNYNRD